MSATLFLNGFVRDVRYTACLATTLQDYNGATFDINAATPCGTLSFVSGQFAYSRWVSPKRTRTYPFERLYNTFNAPSRLTIIPVIKDEGASGDLDRIQYSTISWMNLLNVYIVLGHYADATKNRSVKRGTKECLTTQKLDMGAVNTQIGEILAYKQSALHWNRTLLETRFINTYRSALDAYAAISTKTGVAVHDRKIQERYLASVLADYGEFKARSLRGSAGAAVRESNTTHQYEYLSDGAKAVFAIENYLGGVYHLTADEVIIAKDGGYVIQESKNAKEAALPGLSDIKDGLFKLILFSNLDRVEHNAVDVSFACRLKLTGRGVKGSIRLPETPDVVAAFLTQNVAVFRKNQQNIILLLQQEAEQNNLTIEIGANAA